MDIESARFHRELLRRIAKTFPRSRLPFFQSLQAELAFSAFQKINRILPDEKRAWYLSLLALHVLYEGWHELPPLSVAERKALVRNAQSLRVIARDLRSRRLKIENNTESAVLERMADQLESIVCPSASGIYNLKGPRGKSFDPRDAIAVFELASLLRQRLSENGIYPVIVDLMNALPGRSRKYNVGTIKTKLARLKGARFQPRVQFIYTDPDVVTLKFRNVLIPNQLRVTR